MKSPLTPAQVLHQVQHHIPNLSLCLGEVSYGHFRIEPQGDPTQHGWTLLLTGAAQIGPRGDLIEATCPIWIEPWQLKLVGPEYQFFGYTAVDQLLQKLLGAWLRQLCDRGDFGAKIFAARQRLRDEKAKIYEH